MFRDATRAVELVAAAMTTAEFDAVRLEASTGFVDTPPAYSDAALSTILSPRHFVEVRRTFGGPSPEETARAAGVSREKLEADAAVAHRRGQRAAGSPADAGRA